jgi:hypothetical protein
MTLTVAHERTQHAAGQGFFHSAWVDVAAEVPTNLFRYVYDCGSNAGAKARNRSIRQLAQSVVSQDPRGGLDIVFISHAHADHINGLVWLLGKRSKHSLRSADIVLPHMDFISRLMAVAATPRRLGHGSFATDYVVNGSGALRRRLNVGRVIEVSSSSTVADSSAGTDRGTDDPQAAAVDDAGSANRATLSHDTASGIPRGEIVQITDAETISVRAPDGTVIWELRTYVDPEVAGTRAAFMHRLGVGLSGILRGQRLTEWLRVISNRVSLVTTHASILRAAYGPRELNVTSMALFSGPPGRAIAQYHVAGRGSTASAWFSGEKSGWLGTGDAQLRWRLAAFKAHYGDHLDRIQTMTVPHHGSRENSNSLLFDAVRPTYAVIAASPRGGYSHPHLETLHAAAGAGAQIVIVNEDRRSEFVEAASYFI